MVSFAPFFIGLAGSIHCMGMCGPLASLVASTGRNSLWKRFLYNGGRIMTYGLLGAIISFASSITSLFGVQAWVSMTFGILLILFAFTGMRVVPPRFVSKPLNFLASFLKSRFSVLLKTDRFYGSLALGMLNGLLPCGMTWVALGYCVTLEWPLDGFISMVLFGLGTVPAMIGFSTIVARITHKFHISFKSIQTALLIVSGCILIFRTFGSPEATPTGEIVTCGIHSTTTK